MQAGKHLQKIVQELQIRYLKVCPYVGVFYECMLGVRGHVLVTMVGFKRP